MLLLWHNQECPLKLSEVSERSSTWILCKDEKTIMGYHRIKKKKKKVVKEERKCYIFSSKITTLEQLPCSSWVAQDRNGMVGVQTMPNSTFAPPPSLPFLPFSWHSPSLGMLKHKPGILLSPFQLFLCFSQCSHHSSEESRSQAALCGEPRSFVAWKKRGSSWWPGFFRAELCISSTKQFL